jgi:pre-mRNA-processing factor 6
VSSYSAPFFILTDIRSEAQTRRGEEPDLDPDQFQDPDNEYEIFAGTTYEPYEEEADEIHEQVD